MLSLNEFIAVNLPFDLNLLPSDSYLVGGVVRDILLQRSREYLDLDFVVPKNAIAIAQKIANLYHAGFVVLDRERNIARVVFPTATIDIAQQEGKSLLDDLARRDYTINAIAYDCKEQKTIDPWQGQQDLERGIIRMISKDNLKEDPLRLLRGYRQGCQLNFTIENQTRIAIKELAPLLANVAEERVNRELEYMLGHIRGSTWLKDAFDNRLLAVHFPHLKANNLDRLAKIDDAIEWIETNHQQLTPVETQSCSLAKLASLTDTNPEIAAQQLNQLKYSRQQIKTVIVLHQQTPVLKKEGFADDLASQYFFFQSVGDILPTLAIFALSEGISSDLVSMLIKRYCNREDKVAHPQPLLTGNDLMQELQLPPSKLIGELLTRVQIAYIEGQVSDRTQALMWIRQQLDS